MRRLVTGEPDIERWPLQAGADVCIILASDGVWDVMSDEDAAGVFLAAGQGRPSSGQAQKLAGSIVDTALQRGSLDNCTAVVLLLQWG